MIRLHGRFRWMIILFFGALPFLSGQDRDFQSWWELAFDKGLGSRFELEGELEQRFNQNSLRYNQSMVTLSLDYQLFDFLRISGGFRTLLDSDRERQLSLRYRLHSDVRAEKKMGAFEIDLRTRLQYGVEDVGEYANLEQNDLVWRNRLRLSQHIFGTRWDWFLSLESWHLLSPSPLPSFYQMRYAAGFMFRPGFRSRFSIRYMLDDEFQRSAPDQDHILVLGYHYSF